MKAFSQALGSTAFLLLLGNMSWKHSQGIKLPFWVMAMLKVCHWLILLSVVARNSCINAWSSLIDSTVTACYLWEKCWKFLQVPAKSATRTCIDHFLSFWVLAVTQESLLGEQLYTILKKTLAHYDQSSGWSMHSQQAADDSTKTQHQKHEWSCAAVGEQNRSQPWQDICTRIWSTEADWR